MVFKVKSKTELEEQFTKAGDLLVVVDFYAEWCGPCKTIAPVLERLAEDYKGKIVVLKVDVDESEELVGEYKIQVMPTFVFIRASKHLDTLSGSNQDKLKELIVKHI